MRAFVTGASGFVGGYLVTHLTGGLGFDVCEYNSDILDKKALTQALADARPDYIFHLAAQSSVAESWKNSALTIDVNIKGTVNILDSVLELGIKPRILLIGSGEEYGAPDEQPVTENNSTRPQNIYAATKACQNMLGSIYAKAHGLNIVMTRAFNHIGPGQSETFVVSDFCRQVAQAEKGIHPPVINVGNLAAKRDFSDVRDVVKAYGTLAQKGDSGQTYNIGSGQAIAIKEILNKILALSSISITVNEDKQKFRPIDVPVIEADISKIKSATGWKPQISIDTSIEETLAFWRGMV